jgi:hypothetical protein
MDMAPGSLMRESISTGNRDSGARAVQISTDSLVLLIDNPIQRQKVQFRLTVDPKGQVSLIDF